MELQEDESASRGRGDLCVLECKQCNANVCTPPCVHTHQPAHSQAGIGCAPNCGALEWGQGRHEHDSRCQQAAQQAEIGDWNPSTAEAAAFLKKREYPADPTQLQAVAANKLLSAHTTTAAAERNWSAWGDTYTSLCNRLNVETADKLVYVKANMPKKWYSLTAGTADECHVHGSTGVWSGMSLVQECSSAVGFPKQTGYLTEITFCLLPS
eukprot:1136191-Pelagomonas_calceolata.AAC.3